jgi:hypothetical protein
VESDSVIRARTGVTSPRSAGSLRSQQLRARAKGKVAAGDMNNASPHIITIAHMVSIYKKLPLEYNIIKQIKYALNVMSFSYLILQ